LYASCQRQQFDWFTPGWSTDFPGMISEELHILKEHELCLPLLQAYADRELNSAPATEPAKPERLPVAIFEDADSREADWSAAHGLLIAFGLIDIELADRTAGILYRISGDGKRLLRRLQGGSLATDSAEITDADETADVADDDFNALEQPDDLAA